MGAIWLKKTTGSTQAAWTNPTKLWVKTATGSTQAAWSSVKAVWIKFTTGTTQAAWKLVYTTIVPTINTPVTISPTSGTYSGQTLTGTNQVWTNATGQSYYFQSSSDSGFASPTTLSSGTASNSTTYTYTIQQSDMISSPTYFRFLVVATNSIYNTQANSYAISTITQQQLAAPTFSSNVSVSGGFNGSITNYNSNNTYQFSTTAGSVTPGIISGSTYNFSVTGLSPGQSATVTVTVTRSGYAGNSASTTGSALLGAALTPSFGTNTSTSDGFTGSVTNYDANYTWGISVNTGSVNWGSIAGSTYYFTVTGLSPGTSATVTVTTTRSGYNSGSNSTTGSSQTGPAYIPTFGTNTSQNGGFQGSITNYNSVYNWSYSVSAGSYSTTYIPPSTMIFNVTGLSSGQSATFTAYTSRTGYANGQASTTGTANVISPPSVNSYPTTTGTAVASTTITANNGSYNNATIQATGFAYSTSSSAYTSNSLTTTAPTLSQSSSYTVTGSDAAPPAYYYWPYNQILGTNGTTYYVYGSSIVSSEPTISTPVVTHTAGTSSYSASSSTTPSGAGTITYYWAVSSSSTTSCTFTSGTSAPSGTTSMWSGGTIYSATPSSGTLSTGFISGRYVHCMAVVSVSPGTYYVRSTGVSHTAE